MRATTLAKWLPLTLFAVSSAKPVTPYQSMNVNPACSPLTISVAVNATNVIFNLPTVNNNIEAVAWALEDSRRTNVNRTVGEKHINQTFSIAANLCVPPQGAKRNQLQILTHGQFANSVYWDVRYQPENYSYVDHAVAAGYSVLNYDRLTAGNSEKPDAYTVAQTAVEVEILRGLSLMARDGRLAGLAPSVAKGIPFEKIIHVGHSYGSALTASFIAQYSDLTDGAIITGALPPVPGSLTQPAAASLVFAPRFAPELDPLRYGDYPSGYIGTTDAYSLQAAFFSRRNETDPAGFDDYMLEYAYNEVSAPITYGEWLSKLLVPFGPATRLTAPVLFFEGEFDLAACLADCRGAFNATGVKEVYPNAKTVDYYLQPGAGHATTMHRNASAGYQVMLDWFDSNVV